MAVAHRQGEPKNTIQGDATMKMKRGIFWRLVCACCATASVLAIVGFASGWFGIRQGPSSLYFEPRIVGEVDREGGKYVAYYGDRIFVTYSVIRLEGWGNCLLDIHRYAEEIGGMRNGYRHEIDHVQLEIKGNNDLLRPQWPVRGLVLGDGLKLRDGVNQQEFAMYVVARYHCGLIDDFVPRYIQGGEKPNETPRVGLVVKRNRL